MQKIVSLIEEKNFHKKLRVGNQYEYGTVDISSTVGFSACEAADWIDAAMIVCLTQTGSTARMISHFRPRQSLIAVTHTDTSLQRLNLIWGILPYKISEFGDNFEEAIDKILSLIRTRLAVKKGEKIIITAGMPFYSKCGTNMLRIEEI
jgi:pyruvate kinase